MGDGGDQGQDTDEFTSDAELDQIARDAEAVQGGRSNIVGSSSYDAQFTADNLEARGLPPENFMSAANFAQTRQGGAGGDDTTSTPEDFIDSTGISVPSITAASSNLAPGILGETLSDFQSGVRSGPQVDRDVVDVGAQNMLEAAIASKPRDFSDLDLIPTTGFLPAQVTVSDKTGPGTQAAIAATLSQLDQARNRRAGLGDQRGIDFGVTQQLLPTTTPTARPKNVRQRIEDAVIQEALDDELVKTEQDLDRPVISEYALGALDPMLGARTKATGAFDPDAIMEEEEKFGTLLGTTLEDIERLSNVPVGQRKAGLGTDPTFLQGMGVPSFLSGFGDFVERTSRDRMAARLARGDVEEKNIVRNANGLVIGIKDAQGNLIEGIDPDAMMQDTGDGGDQPQKRVAPKAPTDPCPDGYQLIDGKCTPTGATDTGTGFMMFPTDRTPPFRTGPFTPTTVATNPNIRALNPVTFGLSNIFRR